MNHRIQHFLMALCAALILLATRSTARLGLIGISDVRAPSARFPPGCRTHLRNSSVVVDRQTPCGLQYPQVFSACHALRSEHQQQPRFSARPSRRPAPDASWSAVRPRGAHAHHKGPGRCRAAPSELGHSWCGGAGRVGSSGRTDVRPPPPLRQRTPGTVAVVARRATRSLRGPSRGVAAGSPRAPQIGTNAGAEWARPTMARGGGSIATAPPDRPSPAHSADRFGARTWTVRRGFEASAILPAVSSSHTRPGRGRVDMSRFGFFVHPTAGSTAARESGAGPVTTSTDERLVTAAPGATLCTLGPTTRESRLLRPNSTGEVALL